MIRSRASVFLGAALVCAGLLAAASPAGAQYITAFGKNKVRYDDFEWKVYHSTHFDVYYYVDEENLLEKVVSFAESAYDQLSREFDYQIQEPTPLIFYDTHSAFEQNNIILNFIPEGVGAFASPVRNRMVMPVDLPDDEMMKLLLHELTHIFQYHILFQGSLGRVARRPPQWVMEGMASYMADDEAAHDRMFLRDAVVNDRVPAMTEANPQGYIAYRLGHSVFRYIEERWGKEGFLDFVYELRNTIGARPGRAIERAFRLTPEDFDTDYRRWLRKRYLKQLVETGEPNDFGRPFRVAADPFSQESSPVASPSGDLIAAISRQRGDEDVVLFETKTRRQIRNLTKGFNTEYVYLASQGLSVPRRMGRDIAFSPDGNQLAIFARQDGGRSLLLLDVLKGGINRSIQMEIEQQLAPAWSPDGRTVAFSGANGGQFDIYLLDLETEEITKLTDDTFFDGAPTFSPDGRHVVFSSEVGDAPKLFRVAVDDPAQRVQLTFGDSRDIDAVYSPDGNRLYFTSDRGGFDNIYMLDFENSEIRQFTDVVTGCFMPSVLPRQDEQEALVYTGFWKSQFRLYLSDLEEPIGEAEVVELSDEIVTPGEQEAYEPPIEVAVDDANKEDYGGWDFFLENAFSTAAVDNNNAFIGQIYLQFSDYLGDRRILAILSSYDALSNFDINYFDLSDRLQWQLRLFDDRLFGQVLIDDVTGQIIDRRQEFRQTGITGSVSYPTSFYTRVQGGLGYIFRKAELPVLRFNQDTGFFEQRFVEVEDDFPWVFGSFVRDTAIGSPWGEAVSGSRVNLTATWAPDLDDRGDSETLASSISLDARKYFSISQRTGFAFRAFAGAAEGNAPNPFYIGGWDTLRGIEFRSRVGDRVFFVNSEYRFPLIDLLATPVLNFRGIRGRVFLDVGGSWFSEDPNGFDFWDSDEDRLDDAISFYGVGLTARFLGLDLHWDLAKRWDFDSTLSDGFETQFYIGRRF